MKRGPCNPYPPQMCLFLLTMYIAYCMITKLLLKALSSPACSEHLFCPSKKKPVNALFRVTGQIGHDFTTVKSSEYMLKY